MKNATEGSFAEPVISFRQMGGGGRKLEQTFQTNLCFCRHRRSDLASDLLPKPPPGPTCGDRDRGMQGQEGGLALATSRSPECAEVHVNEMQPMRVM